MKKTEKYQLNQWELSDRVRMEDFNADNVRLEEILEGKTGRFEKIYQYSPGAGANFAGASLHITDWSKWECVLAAYDLHKTSFLADDRIQFSMMYTDLTYDAYLEGLGAGSFFVFFLPFHDKTAKIQGMAVGKGSRTFFTDRPFQDLMSVSMRVKNDSSTGSNGGSTTTLQSPLWTVYGIK